MLLPFAFLGRYLVGFDLEASIQQELRARLADRLFEVGGDFSSSRVICV